jgi:hypothetical protein
MRGRGGGSRGDLALFGLRLFDAVEHLGDLADLGILRVLAHVRCRDAGTLRSPRLSLSDFIAPRSWRHVILQRLHLRRRPDPWPPRLAAAQG